MRIKTICKSLLIILSAFLLFRCGGDANLTDSRYLMDTIVTLQLPSGSETALESAFELAKQIENSISRTMGGSDVYRFNNGERGFSLNPHTAGVVKTALDIYKLSGGAYDPTIEPLVTLWNITGGDAVIPSDAEIAEAMAKVDAGKLSFENGVLLCTDSETSLDLGGVGKGYACQAVCEYLVSAGVPYGVVSFGGNVGVFGQKPEGGDWKIGVRDPDDSAGVVGYLYIDSGYVSVSGDYERYFELDGVRYHHILDPSTGYPARSGLRSVAVWSYNGAEADALSTALFVMGAEASLELYESGVIGFEAVFITGSGEIITTTGLADIFEAVQ